MKKIKAILALVIPAIAFSQIGIDTKYPTSTITVNGSYAGKYRVISSSTLLTVSDQLVNVINTSTQVTLILPVAVVADAATDSFFGRVYYIKNSSVNDVVVKGNGNQLLWTGAGSISNTITMKPGQSVRIVKNTNNSETLPLWDLFKQSIVSDDNNFGVGAVRSFKLTIPAAPFIQNFPSGTVNNIMYGKLATESGGQTHLKAAWDVATAADRSRFIIINGLRMDFMKSELFNTNGDTRPKFFNTTNNNINYNISSLSTTDRYLNGGNTTIAPSRYSFNIDGNDDFSTTEIRSEYVNAMLTFPNGEWYNCTWHSSRDANNYYFYFTAQRLN